MIANLSFVWWLMLALVIYILITKVIYDLYKLWYYKRQGIPFLKGYLPILGHIPRIVGTQFRYTTNEWGIAHLIAEDYPPEKPPPILGFFLASEPILHVNDPHLINELYITKNKYFDKHPLSRNVIYPLMGDSILLS
jgi:hypothetical protein